MCAVANDLHELYRRHAGHNTRYHLAWVRRAREMLNAHRKQCAECRPCYEHGTWNIREPGQTIFYKPQTKGRN